MVDAATSSKRILVAPLDWGLGHATRCIPIIDELLRRNCDVQLAGSGASLSLLQQEYPSLKAHALAPYRAHYSAVLPLALTMLFQLPKFLRAIQSEHRQLARLIEEEKIDIVISDNRYGFRSSAVPCVLITHQVNVLMPAGWSWAGPLVNYFIHRQIRKFQHCWVPDENENRITGVMSEASGLPIEYIGMLSRFQPMEVAHKYDLLVLLSGPEPHRSRMESHVMTQLVRFNGTALVVRGLPDVSSIPAAPNHVAIHNHLNAKQLNQALAASAVVLSRPGYSTVMDLARLHKRAVFIATPGQTEQLYLTRQLEQRKMAPSVGLKELNLASVLRQASDYAGLQSVPEAHLLEHALNRLLL